MYKVEKKYIIMEMEGHYARLCHPSPQLNENVDRYGDENPGERSNREVKLRDEFDSEHEAIDAIKEYGDRKRPYVVLAVYENVFDR